MLGKSPLWMAKQHGHTITTMLKAYAAWTEGATERDVPRIKRAMASEPTVTAQVSPPETWELDLSKTGLSPVSQALHPDAEQTGDSPAFATGLATGHRQGRAKCSKRRVLSGGERGIRTLEGLLTLTPLAGPTILQCKLHYNLYYLTPLIFVI